jgi:cation transporter-like permease
LGLDKPSEKPASSTSGSGKSSALKIGKKPLGIGCLLGPIVGGGISSIVGVVVGHISSFLYTLVGDTKNTGLAYLLSGVTFVISFGMSMGLSTIAKRIGLKPK